MLALAFTFPAGRYHATPWDRHVNEGAVAWPPEPWRLLRALIATWHHKVKPLSTHDEVTLRALIDSLSQELPHYTLPAANHSHTRHYMPQFKSGKTSLVFDAFTAVDRQTPLFVTWEALELPADQTALLDDLLSVMGYLGRAESWVEARRVDHAPDANCTPGHAALDTTTGELHGESVTLYAPLPAGEYDRLRSRFLTHNKAIKKLGKTLPDTLLAALSVDTADLRKQGWNQPPAARKVSYLRPVDALRPKHVEHRPQPSRATTACLLLIGKPLPRVEDSVRIGELLRAAIMSASKKQLGEHAVPTIFSGHNLSADNRHGHAFYLPWDSNGDGRIDRIVLHVPDGMSAQERHIAERLRHLWSRDGSQWRVVLENIGDTDIGGPLTTRATQWQSITPYLHPWHVKKHFDVRDQIRRECRERELPEPASLEPLDDIQVGSGTRRRRAIHFHRFRNKRNLTQPDRRGSFWRLTFSEPVNGPIALGFGCHFGLGLFQPDTKQS